MLALKTLVVVSLATSVSSSAIPIWELLTRQEKMGRLLYVFIHLVEQYCKESTIPDCQKVLTLYGMSNLVNEEEDSLDHMDPYQRNARSIIWEKVMKGSFKLPSSKSFYPEDSISNEDYDLVNEVQDDPYPLSGLGHHKALNDPHPYSVRVPAPTKIAVAHTSSSHPFAVRVAPEVITEATLPVGLKASADFEPMMTESRKSLSAVQRLLPSLSAPLLVRSRRASNVFPEDEMKELLSRIFRK